MALTGDQELAAEVFLAAQSALEHAVLPPQLRVDILELNSAQQVVIRGALGLLRGELGSDQVTRKLLVCAFRFVHLLRQLFGKSPCHFGIGELCRCFFSV
ncbi:hypothetical protein Rhopal_002672-T1 [Rhodotorula paludigena]|uniref:Uncharacterized protein n=1 Tax=Rhodotorula paludigena TaxID=86838 RepID=A0AAV5GJL6_9BASI|nr:hypothetical protein Rhopal_002672-T1 [Rhodotorula paludigena]